MGVTFFHEVEDANDPLFVMAFSGWNDAAESATAAARYLIQHFQGKRVAQIQPDDFFQFADQRPTVKLGESGERQITWPLNEFFYCQTPGLARDIIIGIGTEPHLKWKNFSRDVLAIGSRYDARMIVTLGALLAGDLHTQPSRLMAIATDSSLVEPSGVEITRYEGPTGIVGVIHTLMQDEGFPAISLWANVPHYIASLSNPKATCALLEKLSILGDFDISLEDFELAINQFDGQVERIIARDPRIAKYVEDIQKGQIPDEVPGVDFEDAFEGEPEDEEGKLPPGAEVADEIERLLRRKPNGPESD
ncbi:MAG: PAC2 family protein [Nitrospinae bacterium]|nr:PAC2 family protein [Nitrospinota bacterium]